MPCTIIYRIRSTYARGINALSGQQVFIYQTDSFIKIAAESRGAIVAQEAVEEIREVSATRSRQYRTNPPAVDVEQLNYVASSIHHHGLLEIDLLGEVRNMTGSGHFYPEMDAVPHVVARIISTPEGCPTYEIGAGTGTMFDFNIHIRSTSVGTPLPVGHYTIEYRATCEYHDEGNEGDFATAV